jgi:putative oxygen-independent coproporphyrinogen III oxidase
VTIGLPAAPPLALYLHFPWCVRKCPYCDFNSHTLQGQLPQQQYLEALRADLEIQAPLVAGREISSVFLGGGTPSLFTPEALGGLFEALRRQLALSPQAEITLEANPGTIERGRFAEYRAAGINRVSLGAQSFAPAVLERLGRIHSSEDTRVAAAELHAAGLSNFNLDLMYALPGQDLEGALADVRAALALSPAHLSHYQLTLEPGTVFGALPPAGLPDEDLAMLMQQHCQAEIAAAGFRQYEVSAYARAGMQCAHNLNYWNFGDYLGAGAGAHGKLSDLRRGAIERTLREREPRRYLARGAREPLVLREVAGAERPFEFMMNALRLVDGFSAARFEERTALPWSQVAASAGALEARGLLEQRAGTWRATALGQRFLNDVIAQFLPEQAAPARAAALRGRQKTSEGSGV